jgi:hypothetical protein
VSARSSASNGGDPPASFGSAHNARAMRPQRVPVARFPAPRERRPSGVRHLHRAVVVAVVAVRMVQLAIDQIIRVVAVRHGLVPAPRSVTVPGVVAVVVPRGARGRVGAVHLQAVVVHVVPVRVVQVPVVQVIDVPVVADGRVSAVRSVLVVMPAVRPMIVAHFCSSAAGFLDYHNGPDLAASSIQGCAQALIVAC